MRRKSVNCLDEEIEELKEEVAQLKEELSSLRTLFEQRIGDLQRENDFFRRR